MELKKQWNDGSGDVLTASYEGVRDGNVSFSSPMNEGVERTMSVLFKYGDSVYAERNVVQEGRREVYVCTDGEYICTNGGTYNVLRNGL